MELDPAHDHLAVQGRPLARLPLRRGQNKHVGGPTESLQQEEELWSAIHRAPRVLIHDDQQIHVAAGCGIAARQGPEEPGLAHAGTPSHECRDRVPHVSEHALAVKKGDAGRTR